MSSRNNFIDCAGLRISADLYDFVQNELTPGTDIDPATLWEGLANLVEDLGPRNQRLLEKRDELQEQIDQWHREHRESPATHEQEQRFLASIGYLVPEGPDFSISTTNLDREVSATAGPQLVVPLDNARYTLNAANARWVSLFDALYGTDVIDHDEHAQASATYNPVRGAQVIARANHFLDHHLTLADGSHADVLQYRLSGNGGKKRLEAELNCGRTTFLQDDNCFAGYVQTDGSLTSVLLRHHELRLEIQIDRNHTVGKEHPAGVKDILVEAAVTTIQDCEDSVAVVDAADKVGLYRNWLELMRGTLAASFEKNGREVKRVLREDKSFTSPAGRPLNLPGRSMLMIRNVGIHMFTDAVTTGDKQPIPEAFLDALITTAGAIHDLKRLGKFSNSRAGSVYIVKPKLHGPEEVAATVELFARVEDILGLPRDTIKIGIMDEERRTTLNLRECIREAQSRIFFINTGFLDRTGDEIHTIMQAGTVLPKHDLKQAAWLLAYERNNVDIGLRLGFTCTAQIGKGMWTMPDRMSAMLETKASHLRAGASTAWVPSPTAAALHALHYHQVDVKRCQEELKTRSAATLPELMTECLLADREFSAEQIQVELDNNVQGILGYVVHWVNQGIGCSKVADINNVGLMEDRATLRISSQHIANWLLHGLVSEQQVHETFQRMAKVVDQQNQDKRDYEAMSEDLNASFAYQAALALVLEGVTEPNGYTERVLFNFRRLKKESCQQHSQEVTCTSSR